MKNYTPVIILVLVLLLATLFILKPSKKPDTNMYDVKNEQAYTTATPTPTKNPFDSFEARKVFKTNLVDVSEGTNYRFVQFSGESYGEVTASFENGTYTLLANLYNLPEPGAENFYEGWLVKPGKEVEIISTGRADLNESGVYVNNFDSIEDLTKYTFYVVTFESTLDNNPEPDRHILEGTLVLQK